MGFVIILEARFKLDEFYLYFYQVETVLQQFPFTAVFKWYLRKLEVHEDHLQGLHKLR